MDKTKNRAELRTHTCVTTGGGVLRPEDVVRRAYDRGLTAMAITDHGSLQSFPGAFEELERIHKTDDSFKVIYGVEIDVLDDDHTTYPMTILVRNQVGLKNLYKLMSMYLTGEDVKRGLLRKDLERYREGLLYGSSGIQGELARAITEDGSDSSIRKAVDFYDYIEIFPRYDSDCHANGKDSSQEAREAEEKNKTVYKSAMALGKTVVASANVYFTDGIEETAHRILRVIDGDGEKVKLSNRLMDTDEMLEEFSYLGRDEAFQVVVTNTKMIADSIDFVAPIRPGRYYPVLSGAFEQIEDRCRKRILEMYGENRPDIVDRRLDWELSAIKDDNYATLYIIANEIVECAKENGYTVGSRGSAASSFVAFLLGITDIDPLPPHYVCPECHEADFDVEYGSAFHTGDVGIDLPNKVCPRCGKKMKKEGFDIPAETFMGFDGAKEPDFDLNLASEIRDKAVERLNGLSFVDRTLKCSSIYYMSTEEARRLVKEYEAREAVDFDGSDEKRLIEKLCGVKGSDCLHPGGEFIIPKGMEVEDFTPEETIGGSATHFDGYSLCAPLLKMDILGHYTPLILKMLKDETGVDPTEIPLEDARVMSLLMSTAEFGITPEQIGGVSVGTLGVPELGSISVIKALLPALKISRFSDLIRLSGFSHGTKAWSGNAEDLIASGKAASECIAHRDDIMLYLISKGMEREEAYRAMEKVRKGRWAISGPDEHLTEQMREHGVPEWYIDSCTKIQYLFPKAHSASYMLNAWRMLWYKLYHPEAFYRAVLSCTGDPADIDIARKGIEYARVEYGKALAKSIVDPDDYRYDKQTGKWLMIIEMYERGISI